MSRIRRFPRAGILLALILMILGAVALSPVKAEAASAKPAKVKLVKAGPINQMIVVKWNKAAKAKKYEIYAKAGTAKWKKVKTVKATGKSTQTWRMKGCKWNTRYQVKVRAVNGSRKGSFSNVKRARTFKKITLEKALRSKTYKKMLDDTADELSGGMFDVKITVSGNTLIYRLDVLQDLDDEDAAAAALEDAYKEKALRKDMKDSINQFENKTGLAGVKSRVQVYSKSGRKLVDCTFK